MIKIIDYGLGNIQAFLNIYKVLNIDAGTARYPSDLDDASHIIIPGVGSFDLAIRLFNSSGMREAVESLVINKSMPVLGVCVGMQILASSSEEGKESGLGWIPGKVKKIGFEQNCNPLQLPHMGWNDIRITKCSQLFPSSEAMYEFYFLHSYHFCPDYETSAFATFNYGNDMVCAVGSGNIFGVQFHPEKSHESGINLLKNFAKI
jgi:glutamine amidotransferase